jgi:hypothetical protein
MAALARVPTGGGGQHRYLVKRNEEFPAQEHRPQDSQRAESRPKERSAASRRRADQGCGYRVLHLFVLSLLPYPTSAPSEDRTHCAPTLIYELCVLATGITSPK